MTEFLHPSVSAQIVDDSFTFVTATGQTTLFAAFTADKGPDNRHRVITSSSEFIYVYGQPNMRVHGQTAYNVVRWLDAGGVAVCCRVLPFGDATSQTSRTTSGHHAFAVVQVGIQVAGEPEAAGGIGVNDALTLASSKAIRTSVSYVGTPATAASLATLVGTEGAHPRIDDPATQTAYTGFLPDIEDTLAGTALGHVEEATGTAGASEYFRYYPIFYVRAKNRGRYGNNFSFTLDIDNTFDRDYKFRTYQLSFFEGERLIEGPYLVSTYPEAQDRNGLSLFMPDVINQFSENFALIYNEDNYNAITKWFFGTTTPGTGLTATEQTQRREIDIFSLNERVGSGDNLHTGWGSNSGTSGTVNLLYRNLSERQPLKYGSDGNLFSVENKYNTAARNTLLGNAYGGSGDSISTTGDNTFDTYFSDIRNNELYEIDVVLDAGYTANVKAAISTLTEARKDFTAYLDQGNAVPTSSWAVEQRGSYNNFYTSLWTQDYVLTDPFLGGDIRVTPTWWLAQKIPYVDSAFGHHISFVGPRRGSIVGFKTGSFFPNATQREALYKAQINYAEREANGTVALMTHRTSQQINSALSDIPNVRVLLLIKRELVRLAKTFRLEQFNQRTIDTLQNSANEYVRTWVDRGALNTASVQVYASDYDRRSRLLRMLVRMQFVGFVERIAITLNVQR